MPHRTTPLALASLLLLAPSAAAQGYTSWIVGDPADVVTAHQPGLVLAGGGGDNDDAMAWMLRRAQGGDVVVLRASGGDGYNDYFCAQLGVAVDSVETLRVPSAAAAADPYVVQRVRAAEVVFLAGGDQYDYYQAWKDGPLEDALQHVAVARRGTVGGTSAGMAILGEVYYAPSALGVVSAEALADPYHPNMDVLGRGDFLRLPWLADAVTDTHFDQRDRAGRLVAFLARAETDWGVDAFGLACNEYTAVCVDGAGWARVFGEAPAYPDYAYFVHSRCAPPASLPERCVPGASLDWRGEDDAVAAYRVPGTPSGANGFDLADRRSGSGGEWRRWFVADGALSRLPGSPPDCVRPGCAGDGTAAACPCANPGGPGEGCRNSTGAGARLTAAGSARLAEQGTDPLVLRVAQAPPNRTLVWLQGAGRPPATPFRDGLLCVGDPTLRLPGNACGVAPQQLDAAGVLATDDPTYGFDLVATALCKGDDLAAAAPTTRWYQGWFRDGMGPCASGSNLSNALRVVWEP